MAPRKTARRPKRVVPTLPSPDFPNFCKLPLEIQDAIWDLAIEEIPSRWVEIRSSVEKVGLDNIPEGVMFICRFTSPTPIPYVLHLHSRSRHRGLRRWSLMFAAKYGHPKVYFDSGSDNLYFGDRYSIADVPGLAVSHQERTRKNPTPHEFGTGNTLLDFVGELGPSPLQSPSRMAIQLSVLRELLVTPKTYRNPFIDLRFNFLGLFPNLAMLTLVDYDQNEEKHSRGGLVMVDWTQPQNPPERPWEEPWEVRRRQFRLLTKSWQFRLAGYKRNLKTKTGIRYRPWNFFLDNLSSSPGKRVPHILYADVASWPAYRKQGYRLEHCLSDEWKHCSDRL